jgi:hypothetical protein
MRRKIIGFKTHKYEYRHVTEREILQNGTNTNKQQTNQ